MWNTPAFRYWYLPWATCVALLLCQLPRTTETVCSVEELPPPPGPPAPVCEITRQPPRFPGGPTALDTWIAKRLAYATTDSGHRTAGIAEVSFVVGPDGRVWDPRLTRDPGHDRGQDLLRAFREMQAERIEWQPEWVTFDCLDFPQATSRRLTYRVRYNLVWVANSWSEQ